MKRTLLTVFALLLASLPAFAAEPVPGGHTLPPVELICEAIRWMDDQSAGRQAELLAAEISAAEALSEAGDPAGAWLKLVGALEKYKGGSKLRAAAAKLKKTLERTPEVKTEVKAEAKLRMAMTWIEKNRGRMETSTSAKAQGLKKLREVVDRYAGTHAAKLAEEKLAELE